MTTRSPWAAGWALSAAVAALAAAAEPSVEFDVQPRVLQVGEQAVATLSLRNLSGGNAPALPDLDGFQVEPAGIENRFEIANGVTQRSVVHRFILRAVRAGDFTIGPFRYEADGRTFEMPAVRVSVAPASAGAPSAAAAHAMARLRISRPAVYVHEKFTVTIELLYRGVELHPQVDLAGLPQSGIKFGQFAELPARREVVDGQVYEVRSFQSEARALASGDVPLAPVLRAQVVTRRRGRSRGDPFFGDTLFDQLLSGSPFDRTERQPIELPAVPVTLTVKPLPTAGRPASFSGAVGACTWDVDVRPTDLAAGEPVTVTMVVRGDANLDAVQAPALSLGPEFRVYEPRLVPRSDAAASKEKIFEQIVIPRDATAAEIPPIEFSYFDPEAGEYRVVSRGPFPLVVRPSTNSAVVLAPGPSAAGPTVLSDTPDLAYLKEIPRRPRRAGGGGWAFRGGGGAWIHAAPVAAALALAAAARRRERIASDVALARREQAPRAARAAVRRLRAAQQKGDAVAFHDALWEALTVYFGHRLNLAPGEVDAERVASAFGPSVEEEVRREIRDLFEACTAVRFGGARPEPSALSPRTDALLRVLNRCEKVRTA